LTRPSFSLPYARTVPLDLGGTTWGLKHTCRHCIPSWPRTLGQSLAEIQLVEELSDGSDKWIFSYAYIRTGNLARTAWIFLEYRESDIASKMQKLKKMFKNLKCFPTQGLTIPWPYSVTWNRFPIKNSQIDSLLASHMWRAVTWIQICASLDHRKEMKPEPSRLIPQKFTENLEILVFQLCLKKLAFYVLFKCAGLILTVRGKMSRDAQSLMSSSVTRGLSQRGKVWLKGAHWPP